MQADPTVTVAARLDHYGPIGVFGFIAGAMLIVFVVIAFGPAVTKRRLRWSRPDTARRRIGAVR